MHRRIGRVDAQISGACDLRVGVPQQRQQRARDFAGRLTHARFRVRMMDDTGRSEREPAGRAEAMILRCHRHRAASVQFHLLEQAGVLRPDGVANTKADQFGNCPVCGDYIDMRDLVQMLVHVQDAEIEISEGPEPPPRQRVQ
jgi:hypothetical protein